MTPAQTKLFIDQGCLRLEGFHSGALLASIRQKVLDDLKRASGGKGMPKSLQGLPVFQQIGKLSALAKVPGLHEVLVTPALIDGIAQLGGRAPASIQPTQLLLSPPNQGTWTLERLNWHVDVTADPAHIPGIQAFFLLDDVAPRAGATLALAGSQRTSSTPSLRALLKTVSPADLQQRLHEQGITIVEMSGRAGDVYLMDMRVLHTPSINATKHIRMMATTRCLFERL
jgi:Phytanoyl-CoA dioxygenase (PhyH)